MLCAWLGALRWRKAQSHGAQYCLRLGRSRLSRTAMACALFSSGFRVFSLGFRVISLGGGIKRKEFYYYHHYNYYYK